MATKAGKQLMTMVIVKLLPRPDRPTNLKSLNLATWFFITAVWFRSSPQKFSSFPALTDTNVPSGTSWNVNTLNPIGRDLLDLQWLGRGEHKTHGEPVCTSSPCSPRNSCKRWSGTMTSGGLVIISGWEMPALVRVKSKLRRGQLSLALFATEFNGKLRSELHKKSWESLCS